MKLHTDHAVAQFASWVDLLRHRAETTPDRIGYVFLADGEAQELPLTYGQLDRQARAIAVALIEAGAAGGRALLLYPPGLELLGAIFGCWYAGVTAAPAYPPRSAQQYGSLDTLQSIAHDAEPAVVMTASRLRAMIESVKAALPALRAAKLLATDEVPDALAAQWRDPAVGGDGLALLQYTSGSTGTPRGVMLAHANLFHNNGLIQKCFGHTSQSHGLIWLPPYHDMGLIGGLLQPLFTGSRVTIMAPAAFLQRPMRWLRAISRYRATSSGGPNFAYELCVRAFREEDRAGLDLSSWNVAFNGAEPIHRQTLDRFADTFASCGFRREAFYPCYGLAESTLIVSGGELNTAPLVASVGADAMENHQIVSAGAGDASKSFVGCGRPRPGATNLIIVNPDTRVRCAADRVGEVWVRSESVARGYWRRPQETSETFEARLADSGEGPFLRTGDLGFILGEQLFISGRLKDLIIIRGLNHYPQDIEQTVQSAHPAARVGCGAAFSINDDGAERLVIVQEVERTQRDANMQEVMDAIRSAVAQRHELQVWSIVLVRPAHILKTSSGKIRRRACRTAFINGTLESLASWTQPAEPVREAAESEPPVLLGASATADEIETLVRGKLAEALSISSDEIDPSEPFAGYGLDSAGAVGLAGVLEMTLGRKLPPTLFYDYPSVGELSRHLASHSNRGQ